MDGQIRLSRKLAYDICPRSRMGRQTHQAMLIHGGDRRSLLESCRRASSSFLLTDREARELINAQVAGIRAAWSQVCDEAEPGEVDRHLLWRRQFLDDYVFDGYVDGARKGL